MATFDAKDVRRRLAELGVKDESRRVFGATGHRWKLAPTLTERGVASAQEPLGVELPADYRTFLIEVGAGGAGP